MTPLLLILAYLMMGLFVARLTAFLDTFEGRRIDWESDTNAPIFHFFAWPLILLVHIIMGVGYLGWKTVRSIGRMSAESLVGKFAGFLRGR